MADPACMVSKLLIAWSLTALCVVVRAMGMTAALRAFHAFQDVEDALAGDCYLRKREGALADAVSSSADSVKFSREQLEQGQIDMFTVLRLTGENLAAKVQLTQVRASRLRERVNLYLGLGGDFAGTGAPK
jgi:multidrug efflux system outer membrane protein